MNKSILLRSTFIVGIGTLVLGLITSVALAEEEIIASTSLSSESNNQVQLENSLSTASPVNPAYKIEGLSGLAEPVGDYVVGPGRIEVVVPAGQSVTREISVANRISDHRQFELMVEDMSGSADGSANVVLLGDQAGPYSLRDFISYPHQTFNLDLNQRAKVPITITMPANAEPGGYYGAVLVSTVQEKSADERQAGAPRSPIVARIGTLFFITVPGETTVAGSVTDVSTLNDKVFYQSGPVNLGILFENTGSVHLNPSGEVTVRNMFGEEVGYVALEPWFVLPKSLRLKEVSWDRELLFGRYQLEVKVNRGYDDLSDQSTIVIWVLPWKILLGVFSVIFLVILLLRFFVRTFEFKRR